MFITAERCVSHQLAWRFLQEMLIPVGGFVGISIMHYIIGDLAAEQDWTNIFPDSIPLALSGKGSATPN